jgi:hypothetical protein
MNICTFNPSTTTSPKTLSKTIKRHFTIMKCLFLITLFFISKLSFSQKSNSEIEATETFLTKTFSKISTKCADLVPYYSNKKWGYIDRITKKIIVSPLFYDANFFHPELRTYYKDEIVTISASGFASIERQNENENYEMVKGPDIDDKVRNSSNGFKGFAVSKTGELIAYSDLYRYNQQGIPGWNIQLFKYQGAYYGIVKNLEGKAGIIDSYGVPLKNFDFNFSEILPNRNTTDTINAWFFVKTKDSNNYSLINTKGELKFKNEIFFYPLTSEEIFGYTPYRKGDTSAIFDRYEMAWIVKPQTKIKIEGINFSSTINLNGDIPKNRNQVIIFYLIITGNTRYFMDLKGNKFLPKK